MVQGKVLALTRRANRVYQTATNQLQSRLLSKPPIWYDTVAAIPPGEVLVRTQPVQHRSVKRGRKIRKPSKLFRPQVIEYEEDRLRREFYSDHPWELARPRIVLEDDGRDAQRCDWSRGIEQRGLPVNGESVVQRQLWLLNNVKGMTHDQAYDKARKEFYSVRYIEEIERRIAKEEASWVGAYFHKGALEVGMELENREYEGWKKWATLGVQVAERQREAGQYHEPNEAGDGDDAGLGASAGGAM